jgi:heat shock protein HslJ
MRLSAPVIWLVLLIGVAIGEPVPAARLAPGDAPTLQELANATYNGLSDVRGPVTLTDGRWEGKPFVEGGAARPTVALVRDFRIVGDVTGEGADDAIVLLSENSGGSGEWLSIAVVTREAGALKNVATATIGDRVKVRNARIDQRQVVLDVVQAGKDDPMCCPGELATRRWMFENGTLKEGAATVTGRLSLDTLNGTEWVLRAWAWDEPAAAEPRVTLRVENGRASGSSGCNNYVAPVNAGSNPGDVTVGPAASTRKACPDPAMKSETRFFQQLAKVSGFTFIGGRLALSYLQDDTPRVMLFDRVVPRQR